MITYGANQKNLDAIYEKAKSKSDGIFTFRGIAYRVRKGVVTHYTDGGDVIERCYGFHVVIGKCGHYPSQKNAALKSLEG